MTGIIDLHCDTLDRIAHSRGSQHLLDAGFDINLQKLQKGGSMMQFFAIWTRINATLKETGVTVSPYDYVQWIYRCYQQEMAANTDLIAPAYSYADILENREKGLLSAMLSMEDAVALEGKIERIEEFYRMGVRMMSVTWNWENSLGYPQSNDPEKMAKGLKPFGIEAVRRMEELGIIIDVSHLSDGGFRDVMTHTRSPVVASHSNSRVLCNESRNLTDDMLRAIGDRGGVCGLNFYAEFLNKGGRYASAEDIVRHARYIANVAGVDAVALGSDFDGIDTELEFRDYAGMPVLVDWLCREFTESQVEKICSGNILRVIREVVK